MVGRTCWQSDRLDVSWLLRNYEAIAELAGDRSVTENNLLPTYPSHPGETLKEILGDRGWTRDTDCTWKY